MTHRPLKSVYILYFCVSMQICVKELKYMFHVFAIQHCNIYVYVYTPNILVCI